MKEYIDRATDLLAEIWSDKDVNIVEKSYALASRKFNLIDISLNGHGPEEDKKYVRSAFYRKNIRRGNTIIENPKNKYCQFARKGTPKILDIKLQYLQYFQKKCELTKIQRNLAEIIFEGVNLAFEDGKRVELIKTEKLNGENAQVSYHYEYDAWVICSKNVSILASSLQDLPMYREPRYNYALLIADQWFKLLKDMPKDKISQLKKLLDGYTAVGEYCGHPDHQHLIRYEEIGIRWFAIVENFSEQFCIDPFKAKKQLEKFGFKVAKMKSITLTSSSECFYSALQKLYLKTSEAGLQDAQFGMEGSIAYFVVPEVQKNGIGRQVAVGAGKIKTLEYRFLRKIRQKASRLTHKKLPIAEIISSYKQEISEIESQNGSRAPFPHEYYVKILSACGDLVESCSLKEVDLRSKFISLLKIIFYCLYKRISLKKYGNSMIADSSFVERVSEIPFSKYCGLGCRTKIVYIILGLPGMFKSYLGQKVGTHFQKINVPYTIISVDNQGNIQKELQEIYKKQEIPLEHFYLDGSFDSQSIFNIMKSIHKNGDSGSYYKFILIKDQIRNKFECSGGNQYPFNLETIIMCYYGQHQHRANSARLQDKIENLKVVTQKLRRNANLNEMTEKFNLESYFYPFSQKCKFQNLEEFRKLINNILREQDEKSQFNSYGLLILRLDQLESLGYLNEDSVNNEVEHLIKASYPSIPIINFKK